MYEIKMGDRIRQIRLELGYSQENLANELHVSKGMVSHWEKGLNAPRENKLEKIAEMGHVSVDYLKNGFMPSEQEFDNIDKTLESGELTQETAKFLKDSVFNQRFLADKEKEITSSLLLDKMHRYSTRRNRKLKMTTTDSKRALIRTFDLIDRFEKRSVAAVNEGKRSYADPDTCPESFYFTALLDKINSYLDSPSSGTKKEIRRELDDLLNMIADSSLNKDDN